MAAIHFYAADVTKTTWKKCEKSGTIWLFEYILATQWKWIWLNNSDDIDGVEGVICCTNTWGRLGQLWICVRLSKNNTASYRYGCQSELDG